MYNGVFERLEDLNLDGAFIGLGIILLVIGLVVVLLVILSYIFQSIALYKLAATNNVANPWLAWIPFASMYILGKLGFEIYASDEKKNEAFTWILLGSSVATLVLDGLAGLAGISVLVFSTWAYYNIFNKINNRNCVLFTVLTALFGIGGWILFFNRKNFKNEEKVNVKEEIEKETKTETKEEETKKVKYCGNCGNVVGKTSKFCSKCGNKL